MKEPNHRVTLAVIEDEISETPRRNFHSDEIDVFVQRSKNSIVIAEYEFESDPSFGSSVESEGYVVFDKESNLTAVTTRYDRPKPRAIFEALENALDVDYQMPDLDPRDEYDIYRQYGFDSINGYTISFKENSKTFDLTDKMGVTLDPEEEAEERSKFGNKRMSDGLVDEIAREAMDDEMYVWSCDLFIEDYSVSYSDPLVFIGVSEEFLQDIGFEKLFEISREAIR
jgi:hypothetical protein